MIVKNALGTSFTKECNELSNVVVAKFRPDLVIGIATGGLHVLDSMSEFNDIDKLYVKRQRASTKKKESRNVKKYLKYVPYTILNLIRKLEVFFAEKKFMKARIRESHNIIVLRGDLNILNEKELKILIVDDAIDSGGTILDTIDFINSFDSSHIIRTAVLTVTFKEPLVQPDFTLYNQVLLRCPWAMDVK